MSTSYLTDKPATLTDFVARGEALGFSWMEIGGERLFGHEKSKTALHDLGERTCSDGEIHVCFKGYLGSPNAAGFATEFGFVNEHADRYRDLCFAFLDRPSQTALASLLVKDGYTPEQAAKLAARAEYDVRYDVIITDQTVLEPIGDQIYVNTDDMEVASISLTTDRHGNPLPTDA